MAVGLMVVLAALGSTAPAAGATTSGPTSAPTSAPTARDPEPPGRPDDPPRRREPPARPSAVLEERFAHTSLDRSLAAGLQAAPADNRIVGSVIAAGGADVVTEAALTAAASVSDRSTERGGGPDRYDTAVVLSTQHYAANTAEVWLATGENFPDGLSASAVAGARGGPVLLTRPNSLPPGVAAELARLDPERIWIVGGTGVVSDGILRTVQAAVPAATVSRVAGADRYATAAAVAGAFFDTAPAAFVATGLNFPDALGAGPAAAGEDAPALLVTATTVPPATEAQLRRLHPPVVYVVGGSDVVSDGVAGRIRTITGGQVVRVSGSDRYATAAAVADRFFDATTASVVLATGLNFPDGLSAGAVAGALDSPLLLVDAHDVPPRVTIDAARRVSWWLPASGRVLRYTVITHPDDEFAAWSVSGDFDPRRYDVLIVLTTGESTRFCTGLPVSNPWMSLEYLPQPQPTGVQYSERCKKHRMDSWNVFVHGAGIGDVGPYEQLTGGPVTFDGREIPVPLSRDEAGTVVTADTFDLAVGADAAVVSFDMGALTTDEVLWAVQTTRGLADRFPTQVEGDLIGAGYYNDSSIGYADLHEDHLAVYELLGNVDLGLPGSQYQTVGHYQSARTFGATVVDYCGYMCHPAAPAPFHGGMGHFQYSYGWLGDGYWPPGQVDAYAGFSQYESFAKWF
ncbi:cell wall-binding repeat-containing protein [Agromyces tardus]|uniref:Cell wall-binding repeat-containing protein n=1 Tax=Agromyces tardus TaxID=2583849 RepID=A0A3M8AF52_9MICO|nr:cell wall-binding repeat-containing protein [Agromyces tardus]